MPREYTTIVLHIAADRAREFELLFERDELKRWDEWSGYSDKSEPCTGKESSPLAKRARDEREPSGFPLIPGSVAETSGRGNSSKVELSVG